jgi:hypothetical protein
MDHDATHDELLPLLLEICEDFFASAGPAVHHEVDALLQARSITGGPGWLIDMLALTRQRLATLTGSGGSSAQQTSEPHEGGARAHRH